MRIVKLALVAGLMAVAFAAGAADPDMARQFQSLHGLRALAVEITGYSADVQRYGTDQSELQRNVEARIRSAGLDLVTADTLATVPGAALLQLRFNIVSNGYHLPYFSYAVTLQLRQKLPIAVGNDAFVPITTWTQGQHGVEEPARISRLNDYALALLDQFLTDVRAQNNR